MINFYKKNGLSPLSFVLVFGLLFLAGVAIRAARAVRHHLVGVRRLLFPALVIPQYARMRHYTPQHVGRRLAPDVPVGARRGQLACVLLLAGLLGSALCCRSVNRRRDGGVLARISDPRGGVILPARLLRQLGRGGGQASEAGALMREQLLQELLRGGGLHFESVSEYCGFETYTSM